MKTVLYAAASTVAAVIALAYLARLVAWLAARRR